VATLRKKNGGKSPKKEEPPKEPPEDKQPIKEPPPPAHEETPKIEEPPIEETRLLSKKTNRSTEGRRAAECPAANRRPRYSDITTCPGDKARSRNPTHGHGRAKGAFVDTLHRLSRRCVRSIGSPIPTEPSATWQAQTSNRSASRRHRLSKTLHPPRLARRRL
jgi:outer membrane biosynthesis protein TonB